MADSEAEETDLTGWFTDTSKDPCLPGLSRKNRLLVFIAGLVCGAFCFVLASLYLPVLYLKARKFALLFTFGSIMVVLSLSMLKGPGAFMAHMISSSRVLFTVAYVCAVVATLYTSMVLQSTLLTLITGGAQIATLLFFLVNYIPGGTMTLTILFKVWLKTVTAIVAPTVKLCAPQIV